MRRFAATWYWKISKLETVKFAKFAGIVQVASEHDKNAYSEKKIFLPYYE